MSIRGRGRRQIKDKRTSMKRQDQRQHLETPDHRLEREDKEEPGVLEAVFGGTSTPVRTVTRWPTGMCLKWEGFLLSPKIPLRGKLRIKGQQWTSG